jgi:TetR/AcrR family transcriptional regulator, transcriptional repressor of aconitase
MPKVSREYLDERRSEILAAASRCFARDGFHRATMQDIVKESGLSPGAIYRYFEGKEAIVVALANERHARERVLLGQASAEGDLGSALRQLLASFVAPLSKPREREERRLGIQLWAEALRDAGVRKVVRKGVDEPRRHLVELISAAAQQGELFAGIDAEAVARAFIALFHGFILQQAWDERVNVEAYVATLEILVSSLAEARQRRKRAH